MNSKHNDQYHDRVLQDALGDVIHSSQQLARDSWRLACWELLQQGMAMGGFAGALIAGGLLALLGWLLGLAGLVMFLQQWLPLTWILAGLGALHVLSGAGIVWSAHTMLIKKRAFIGANNHETSLRYDEPDDDTDSFTNHTHPGPNQAYTPQ